MRLLSAMLILPMMVLTAGCGSEEVPPAPPADQTSDSTESATPPDEPADEADVEAAAVAVTEADQAAAAAGDVESAAQEAYVGTAEKALAGWGAKLDQWTAAAKVKSAELNDKSKELLGELEAKKDTAMARLSELKQNERRSMAGRQAPSRRGDQRIAAGRRASRRKLYRPKRA